MEPTENNGIKEAKLDATLFTAVIAIACIGATAVFSSTFQQGLDMKSPDPMYFILRHLAYLCAAIGAMYLAMKFEEEELNNYAMPLLLAGIGFLILVFIPPFGIERFGARRWVNLYIFSFQPAEVVKLFFVIYISRFIADRKELVKDFWRGFTPVLVVYAFISILLLAQPDTGSTILIGLLMGLMFFIGGTKIGYLGVFVFGLLFLLFMVLIFSPVKMSRIIGWFDPFRSAAGEGYHIISSIQTIGVGGLFGMGQGAGVHTSGGFLPMASTDFILAVIGEEYGFIGVTTVAVLYLIICYRGMRIAETCREEFTRLLCFGLTLIIVLPALIHMCVVLGLLPAKGLTLPFVSYGGTSLIVSFFCIGLIQGIYLRNQPKAGEEPALASSMLNLINFRRFVWRGKK